MEFKKIDELIVKYFEADTNLEEEKLIQSYFQQESIHESHKAYKALFGGIAQNRKLSLGPSFDERVIEEIKENPKQDSDSSVPGEGRKIRIMPMILRIAAMVVLTAGLFWFVQDNIKAEEPDCVTEACAEEAYEQAKDALLFLSTKLKKGTDKTRQIQKTETLSKVFKN